MRPVCRRARGRKVGEATRLLTDEPAEPTPLPRPQRGHSDWVPQPRRLPASRGHSFRSEEENASSITKVHQVIINVLSEDGDTINNEYVRLDENGDIVGISHAVYDRIR